MFHSRSLETVLRLGPPNVKVYNWLPVTTLVIPSLDLVGDDPVPLISAEADRRGLPFDTVAHEVRVHCFHYRAWLATTMIHRCSVRRQAG